MIFLNLDEQISEAATKSIGFTGADIDGLNSTINATTASNGTAIDTIQRCAATTPDLINTPWIVDMYQMVADIAMDFFWIFVTFALIGYVLKGKGMLSASKEAEMVHLIKKSIIASFMIFQGLPILMMLLFLNQYISEIFGSATSITDLMVYCLTSPYGCVVVVGSCIAIIYNAVFYLIRMLIIFLSCAMWPLAWTLWLWDRTSVFAVNLINIMIINIFLGSAMAMVYWVGTIVMISPGTSNWLTGWGLGIAGLAIMIIAAKIPIIAYHRFIKSPSPTVKNIVYAASKL